MRAIFLAVILLLAAGAPTQAERSGGGTYIAGSGTLAIWCDTEPDTVLPRGTPDDHPTLLRWLFSGDPECTAANAWNDVANDPPEEYGYGGFAWPLLRTESGTYAFVTTDDAIFGAPYLSVLIDGPDNESDSVVDRCGPVWIPIPLFMFPGSPYPPDWSMWAWIPAVAATEDLEICLASTGRIEATIGLYDP